MQDNVSARENITVQANFIGFSRSSGRHKPLPHSLCFYLALTEGLMRVCITEGWVTPQLDSGLKASLSAAARPRGRKPSLVPQFDSNGRLPLRQSCSP